MSQKAIVFRNLYITISQIQTHLQKTSFISIDLILAIKTNIQHDMVH